MDELNKYILIKIKQLIEDAMENEIDEDEFVPIDTINSLSSLHKKLHNLFNT